MRHCINKVLNAIIFLIKMHIECQYNVKRAACVTRKGEQKVFYLTLLQVWISFAEFEKTTGESSYVKNTRQVYQEAVNKLKSGEEKEERLMILESWQAFEVSHLMHLTSETCEEVVGWNRLLSRGWFSHLSTQCMGGRGYFQEGGLLICHDYIRVEGATF